MVFEFFGSLWFFLVLRTHLCLSHIVCVFWAYYESLVFWVIFGLGFCVEVWLKCNFLFVFVCVCHPQFSHLSLSMSRVQSIFLSACFLWLLPDFTLKGSIFLHVSTFSCCPCHRWFLGCFQLCFGSRLFPSLSLLVFPEYLDSCISCMWAPKSCYMKLKSFLFILYFIFMIALNCLYIILCISYFLKYTQPL